MQPKSNRLYPLTIPLILFALAGNLQAQTIRPASTLNGVYAGNGTGEDWDGHQIHQLTKWTFRNNILIMFQEHLTIWQGNGSYSECTFFPQIQQSSYPVSFFDQQPDDFSDFVLMGAYGCPLATDPSQPLDQRPEVLQIIPDSSGAGFSYLEHTSAAQNSLRQVNTPNLPAHLSGHAARQ